MWKHFNRAQVHNRGYGVVHNGGEDFETRKQKKLTNDSKGKSCYVRATSIVARDPF